MLAVVDSNVWVLAFLTPGGTAAKLFDAFKTGQLTPAYSGAIEGEYREVLSRPKFSIAPELVAEFLGRLRECGLRAEPPTPVAVPLPDPDDEPFIALALYLGCPIVTGNVRHFPADTGVAVLAPAQCISQLGSEAV